MRRFCRSQLVDVSGGRGCSPGSQTFERRSSPTFGVMVDYVDPSVDAGLGAVMAVKAGLFRADRLDALVELAQRMSQLTAPSRSTPPAGSAAAS